MAENGCDGILSALRNLCQSDKVCRDACSKFLRLDVLRDRDVKNLLNVLAGLILSQHHTLLIAEHFSDSLPLILAVALSDNDQNNSFSQNVNSKLLHEKRCVALGKLASIHPDVMTFAMKYFDSNPSPFHHWKTMEDEDGPSAKKRKVYSTTSLEPISDKDIALCCYSFLKIRPDHFRNLWDWSIFLKEFVGHAEPYIRWISCQCCALLLKMGCKEKEALLNTKLTNNEQVDFSVQYSEDEKNISFSVLASKINASLPHYNHESVTTVAGITLPSLSKAALNFKSSLVMVNSTQTNLHAIALGIATGKTLCLQGPVGCGKTALVEHIAKLTGHDSPPLFLSIQLGDQTDSKMLLGTYQCTDIPGEFVWKPGVLTQAVVGGHWLLLEDIDSCTTDVAAVLASLLESNTLSVPGFKDCVHAAPGFQLFCTQRLLSGATGLHKVHSGVTSMLQKHWLTVQMEPLSESELVEVVQTLYPSLHTVATRMVDVFLLFSAGNHHTAMSEMADPQTRTIKILGSGTRLPSTRDFIKWCNRSSEAFDVKSPESGLKLFQDAVDIFCCNVSNPETRLDLASSVAGKLGIIHTKADYFCKVHKPIISCTLTHVIAGRVTLPRKIAEAAGLGRAVKSTYSFTRPAAALLERIAACIYHSEPVLLVGETGVGKTSSIQYLAQQMGQSLSVINMNQQSDSADLLGGYKPVEFKYVISPLRNEFETLFRKFFSVTENAKYLGHIANCFSRKKWTTLVGLMKHTTTAALKRFDTSKSKKKVSDRDAKLDELYTPILKNAWQQLSLKLSKVEEQLKKSQSALAFAFVEGSLVRALQEGEWVLLDEINLASAQTLECLSSLLEGSSGSLYLLERGDENSIKRHPNFRIFAAMNPATDVGKKELPAGIRNRFSEFFVDELVDRQDLLLLCGSYLTSLSLPASKLDALVKFYLTICKEAVLHLTDGTGHKPHYSLRTFCRALSVAAVNPCGSVPRSLYEGILLSFLTQLDRSSHPVVEDMVAKAVVGNSSDLKSLIKQPIPVPVVSGENFVQVESYWVTQGPLEPITPDKYIMTKTVRQNLRDLVRVVSLARLPVLLQGETSVGKTSLITYLAQVSGNRCLRINNHEHTDLQEYIGCYAADEQGNLVFKEGVLVEAMRFGHWVILDELNLAPSDVLEALNRVLDDNRELFIPETQKVVKAHPNFMLFATQNPPGLYGGRKVLSRAFRNRFIELHFDEIPSSELETIMHLRCDMPPSYCKKMVAVMSDLQVRRKGSAAFAGKQGFITLRDLFRWGERYRLAQNQTKAGKFYDWDQHIADEGYLILAGRVRKEEERIIIQDSLKKHIKRSVSPEKLFTLNEDTSPVTRSILESVIHQTPPGFSHIVWTFNMRRLAVLLGKACEFKEPILLVGETGCGKTTLCQLLAASRSQALAAVNCHMHSESADFLGGLRPVREHTEESKGKLFEWVDGPLIEAMQNGGVFLADEISLADDSVLERLNSLLEPERKLLLAEKGSGVGGEPCEVTAKDGFIFVGTMNPGGDYGKKELSPALRNRFTEIWCEGCTERSDMIAVIEHNLRPGLIFRNENNKSTSVGTALVDFLDWFSHTDLGNRCVKSIRDIMTWIEFINVCTHEKVNLSLSEAYIHGACLTFVDSLGTGLTSFSTREVVQSVRVSALKFMRQQVKEFTNVETSSLRSFLSLDSDELEVVSTSEKFGMKPFYIPRGSPDITKNADFLLTAPTTRINAMRVLRGLQLGKALLLEGSPGVGKTSLVSALAKAAGYKLTRINLSDQTDVSDLFGADLPVEGGSGGEFAWRDGPFLQALQAGHWILLDELNLASQSVLEGLNAVLDHRGDLFIPELGRTFHIQSDKTRLFACQNPLNQGGARKGLPQSFLNRFTQVYMETLTFNDLEYICQSLFPDLPANLIKSMVNFNQLASVQTAPGGKWGQRGAPWEMNLRDLTRWCEISVWGASNGALNPGRFVQLLYVDRMRTARDKEEMRALYSQSFADDCPLTCDIPQIYITPDILYIGDVKLQRGAFGNTSSSKLVLRHQLPMLQSLARCVSMGWLSILVGPTGCGKTSLIHLLAQLAGRELRTLAVNSAMDTTEILGGFEQADYKRHFDELAVKAHKIVLQSVQYFTLQGKEKDSSCLLRLWEDFLLSEKQSSAVQKPMSSDVKLFSTKIDTLLRVLTAIPDDSISIEAQSDIQKLQEKLTSLKDCAARDNSLNAGGKFEWIDSILIKSLTDGCWLLVDNVNLCSAAVLDRLNGLLEPQGVLTVSERGVNSDGELVTIHPHPDFRLFLTMDPRHGEISRAMRNRGVEIYIAPSEEDMSTSMSQLDLASLLYDVGISSHHDQQMLLSIHETMSSLVQGPDPPGLTELLHASFLFVQQVLRGMPHIPSLVSSFTKVYIQSRLHDNIDTKRRNLSILEEAVRAGARGSVSPALDRLISDSTLKTLEVHQDSAFATVRQRCSILSALASAQDNDLSDIIDFLGISKMKVDLQSVIVNLTILFYQTCSVADVSLARKWLEKVVKGSCHEETIKQLSNVMHNVILNVDDLAKCHLMWDRRWLPDVSSALAVLSGDDDQGVENRVSLLLYIAAWSLMNRHTFDFNCIKKLKQISVLEYSHAVSKGVLVDSLSSDPVITDIGPLLDVAFGILCDSLNTIGVSISDELWWPVRKAYLWVQRFQNQAASVHLTSDKAACEEISNLLAVHYRWFSKYAIPVIIHLAGEAALDVSLLSEVMQRMNTSVFSNTSIIWHLAKKIRQEMGQPLPMSTELQASLTSKALQIAIVMSIWKRDSDTNNFAKVANFLTTPAGHIARASLTVAVRELHTASDLSKVEERLAQAEKHCSEAGLFTRSLVGDQSELPPDQIGFQILLWPFMEAVCLHATGPLMVKLFEDQSLSSYMEEASALIQAMKITPSIPAAFIGFLESFQNEGKSRELSIGISWLFQFCNRSLAISNSALDLSLAYGVEKTMEFLPQHCPVFSQLATNLLFCQNPSNKQQMLQPILDRHFEHAKLLSNLRFLLWRNSEILTSTEFSFRNSEVKSVLAASQLFINSLEKSCSLAPMQQSTRQERATSIIECVEDKLGDKAYVLSGFYSLLLEFVMVLNTIEQKCESSKEVENETLAQVGLAWTVLGCLESQLFSAFPKIDPTAKDAIKRKYTKDDLLLTKSELLSAKMVASVKGNKTDTLPDHPHLKILSSHAASLEHDLVVLNRQVAARPDPPMYSALTKELAHFANSLSSEAVVVKVTKRLMSIHTTTSTQDYHTVLNEAQTWLRSQRSFATMLDRRFALWYPDIVGPVLAASAKLIRGAELLIGVSKKIFMMNSSFPQYWQLGKLVRSIGSFPTLNSMQPSLINLISYLTSKGTLSGMEKILRVLVGENEDIPIAVRSQAEAYWLLKSSVLELKNAICVSETLKNEEWYALVGVLRSFIRIWEKQEAEIREMEQDNESLYKSRGALRCEDFTDEEVALKEIAEMFPSKRENDFGDLEQQKSLDDTPVKEPENIKQTALNVMIDEEDMAFVSSTHVSLALAFTKSTWLSCSPISSSSPSSDYLTPWLQRAAVAARFISSCGYMLSEEVDKHLLPSWILASYQASPNSVPVTDDDDGISAQDPTFDFYRSPCISEVKQCKPVFDCVLKRVNELLSEWPDHPSLNHIVVVINRINSFPIESPLARFLTGLEILLTKMRDWEENAHSGVSLATQSATVTNLIIQWRRLELSCWKGCLNAAALQIEKRAARWWFYIFSLIDSYVNPSEKEPMGEKEIVASLEKFMEDAPLGEFHVRLDMILAFHCHVINLPASRPREDLLAVLWNLYNFYLQFKNLITERINNLRKPIEKKLKDFVKIARWNDINYWAVKQTVDKTQRVLHKHVKEFEKALREAAKATMLSSRLEGKSPRKMPRELNPKLYIAKIDPKSFEDVSELDVDATSVLCRAGSLFSRSKKLSKEIVLSSPCPGLVAALDEFSNDIAESVQQLASLDVDQTAPKDKQKSQAKNQLQMKRKALADLFRMLQRIGLSHHTGLTYEETDVKHEFTQLPPLDLRVYFEALSNATEPSMSLADKEMINTWDGCSGYLIRSWARYAQLSLALRSPHKDHGPPNIERLKGFPAHLLTLAQSQQRDVEKNTTLLAQIRMKLFQLKSLKGLLNEHMPSQSSLRGWNQRLQSLLVSSLTTLQQFRLLLNCCPESGDNIEDNIPVIAHKGTQLSGLSGLVKGDGIWQKAMLIIDEALSTFNQCKTKIFSDNSVSSVCPNFVSPSNYKKMEQCFNDIAVIASRFSELVNIFGGDSCQHPCIQSLTWLKGYLLSEYKSFSETFMGNLMEDAREESEDAASCTQLLSQVNNLMQNILLAIQKLYKDHTTLDEPDQETKDIDTNEENQKEEEEESADDLIQEKHLTGGILKSVASDLTNLNVLDISQCLESLMDKLMSIIDQGCLSSQANRCLRIALHPLPLLEQWLLLYQFVVQQQVAAHRATCKLASTLLAVFGDLAVKGFCTPEGLLSEEEAGEGEESQSKGKGAMGLGDGEGEKDTSERIENEDQLDDARPAGEEKKEEDKDCKEEEKGIEMSENFDSKLQDVESKGDDDEEEDDDDKDAEKEMGDTEKEADQLDQQIWGSDSEEDEEGDGEDEKEGEGQSGEQTGEKEVGARERETDPNNDGPDEKGDERNQEKQKPEINEMDDPEVDDDQVDPYHGNQQPEIEPEPLDLPDDLQLDDGEGKDQEENEEENPFDIDKMKETIPPESKDEEKEGENGDEEETEKDKADADASDDDDDNNAGEEKAEENPFEEPTPTEEELEDPLKADERKSGQKQDDVEDENETQKDEEEEEEEKPDADERNPSKDDPTAEQTEASEDNQQGSKDQVSSLPKDTEDVSGEQPPQEADGDPGGEEKESVGQAPNQELKGHHSDQSGKRPQQDQLKDQAEAEEKRQPPGHSDSQRSLGDINEPMRKRLKTVDVKETQEEEEGQPEEEPDKAEAAADLYQHIKDVKEQSSTQTLDAATKEQAEEQPVLNKEEEEAPPLDGDDVMEVEEMPLDEAESEKQKEEAVSGSKKDKEKKEKGKLPIQNEADAERQDVEIDGEKVDTLGVSRAPETTFHTRFDDLSLPSVVTLADVEEQSEAVRKDIQNQLSSWNLGHADEEATQGWQSLSSLTNSLARDLSEQLRLVLEPTQATRMKGDFRTGRRINMRKVIPYIASQFRKDKIWMRRTKPSKREYQIMLAIDDSSSMADNRSKELAFESLALVSQALTLLEAGELGVLSFGEAVKVLHRLGEPFTQHSGARLLQQFSFDQRKTQIGVLVDYATSLFSTSKAQSSAEHAQLLVVISDGRGVFSEGQEKVCSCVRRARLAGIFMVFVIIDNPESKDSILDIRTPIFSEGKLLGISSYMDTFPFPFYLILRDISNLPAVLSDALRQWFELVSSTE